MNRNFHSDLINNYGVIDGNFRLSFSSMSNFDGDAGFKPGKDIYLSLDVASTEFYKNNKYDLQGEKIVLSSDEMIKYLEKLVNAYLIKLDFKYWSG